MSESQTASEQPTPQPQQDNFVEVAYKTLAENAYLRYGETTNFKNFQGGDMPKFSATGNTAPLVPLAWQNALRLSFDDLQLLLNARRLEHADIKFLSDGYHTFDELYTHRITLFIALAKRLLKDPNTPVSLLPWRSDYHSDGTRYPGWFLMGIGREPGTQITYHLSADWYHDYTDFCETLERAPEWDGHTSADVLKRLLAL